jgi:hypothetical protein
LQPTKEKYPIPISWSHFILVTRYISIILYHYSILVKESKSWSVDVYGDAILAKKEAIEEENNEGDHFGVITMPITLLFLLPT